MNKNIVVTTLAVLIFFGGGYLGYKEIFSKQQAQPADLTATSTVEIAPGVEAEVQGGSSKTISAGAGITAPSLNHHIVIPSGYSDKAATIVKAKIAELIDTLKKNPTSYDNWNDLAIRFKSLGDYKYTEEIWVYLTKVVPNDSDAFINLGDLYAYYLHDNVKAEYYFLKTVEISPKWVQAYEHAVDFYANVLKDPTKAKAFLDKTITDHPEMQSALQSLRESLKS